MAKNWWFKFEYRVWQSDPDLSGCSLAARGLWLEILCYLYAQDEYKLTSSYERLGRMARCDGSEAAKLVVELKQNNVCDVTLGHGEVTVMSRRLCKLLKARKQATCRKRKERVTQKSQDRVISKSKELKKEKNEELATQGGKPAKEVDPVSQRIWNDGVDLVKQSGLNDKNARTFLGAMAKEYSKLKLAEAIAVTQAANTPDPQKYLVAVLQDRAGATDKAKLQVGKTTNGDKPYEPEPPCKHCGAEFCFKDHREEILKEAA